MSKLTNWGQRFAGWLLLAPGEAVQWAKGLNRSTLAWGGLALAAVLFLSLNLAASLMLRNVKADMTEDRLYTISDSTKRMLSKIEEPIEVRVYYSQRLGEVSAVFSRLFQRVKGLLEQYDDLSGGKVRVTFLDPEPFSDAEDRASASGLRGQRINQDGETAYFGLVASNTTDNDSVIPFFTPDRERFLEYDLTKLIAGLANPKKKVVGLLSGVTIDGSANPMNPRAQPPPAWMIIQQIQEFFEIRKIEPTVTEIPKDIDVLMVVQPTILTPDTAYAIDQFALGGGRVLAFVDPVVESVPPGPASMGSLPVSSQFKKVMKSWGLSLDTDKIAGDPTIARRVQFGNNGGQPIVTDYLAWLQIEQAQLNSKDPLVASIRRLNLATAGALNKVDGATTIIQPLFQTSPQGGLFGADMVRFQPNPLAILRSFKPGGKSLMLAARIGGEAKSAFPDGRPKPAEDKAKAGKTATTDGAEKAADATKPAAAKASEAKPTDPKAGDGKAAAPKADEAKPKATADAAKPAGDGKTTPQAGDKNHLTAGRVNVVVVADADMLNDNFWVEVRDFVGQRVAVPVSDNASFVVSALENLSGGEALADLRGRGIVERPFDRVISIRRSAEQRFRQKEEALNAKLKDLQGKLAKVEAKGGEGGAPVTVMLSDNEKQAIEKFRGEMIAVRHDLRDVKSALRRDIDRLDGWLKFFNIAAIPLLIGMAGVGFSLVQRRRNGGGGHGGREDRS
ncbi:MAG: GldG family protein [Hyphomicrobiaceae bacterium]